MQTPLIQRTPHPRPRPDEANLGFGRYFSDHMLLLDYAPDRGWHEPRVVPYAPLPLDPAACVFHYGQALFEGLKAFRGPDDKVRIFQLARHGQRLSQGVERLCMPPIDPELVTDCIREMVRTDQDWVPRAPGTALYIRPTLIGTEAFLGVRPATRFLFFVISSPVGAYYAEGLAPIRLWVEQRYVRAARGGLGAVKAGANYACSLRAAEEAKRRGYAQVLWLDAGQHRYIEEAGTMNVFVRIGDELITPPLEGSILAGVTRECVITLAREWGFQVSERPLSMDEIHAADTRGDLREVFGSGTAAVISPVGELGHGDGKIVLNRGQIGELSQRLYREINAIQHAHVPDRHGWLYSL